LSELPELRGWLCAGAVGAELRGELSVGDCGCGCEWTGAVGVAGAV
jgi:hypothetical protein